jgi:hypothetical protein
MPWKSDLQLFLDSSSPCHYLPFLPDNGKYQCTELDRSITLAISTTYESLETLINRGLSLNLRSINLNLANLFQRYSIALNKINGGELFGRT